MIPDLTKPALLGLLLLWQVSPSAPDPASQFRYERTVTVSSMRGSAETCAVLDADVFAHAAPSLKDLRLLSGRAEIAYATTLSEPLQQESEEARILDLHSVLGHIFFDIEMPRRPYTGLTLEIAAHDYIAKAIVSGSNTANGKGATPLGTFSLFDLTSQHLSHMTDIPLPESSYPYLHLDLVLKPVAGSTVAASAVNGEAIVKSATVPPSREAQSLYTTNQQTTALQEGAASVATFKVQSRVPIERVRFTLPPNDRGSFSRDVTIRAHATPDEAFGQPEKPDRSAAAFGDENVPGSILRVHKTEGGRELSAEKLSIPVSIGSNMQQPAILEVRVENGSEAPLPLSVGLQMRQREICFDTGRAIAPLVLLYGAPSLDAPAYADAELRQAAANPGTAELGPERQNPAYIATSTLPKLNQHRPILRWIALLGCVCIFALLVFRRSAKHRPH